MSFTTSTKVPLQRRYQGVSPEDRQRLRRDRLVEAATEVFGTRGFKHGTMRDICAHARLSDRYFYESFKNIEEVFDEVYNLMAQQLIEAMAQGMTASPASLEGVVLGGLHAFFKFIKDDPRRAQVMLVDAIHAGQYHARHDASTPSNYNRVVKLLTDTMRFETSDNINGRLVASGLVGMAIHTATTWAQDGFTVPIEQVVAHNLYAWRGLNLWAQEQWIDKSEAAAQSNTSQVIEKTLSAFKAQA